MTATEPLDDGQRGGADSVGRTSYRVVARRYRPQRFDELVGQEHVARGMSGAIASGRVGHAYLFTGARGVGKTSAARIFAKALECERGPASEPCNACDACTAISAGSDVDVVEIDAASNRGIDEIRSLRQNVAVRPARGRFKIYIVDEVHMLTREAFNALLKTLEEPPAHVKFVLCTTEPEKLPVTILSRCQRFDFLTVETESILRRLEQIVEAEGVTAEPGALELIAMRASGSMRDSQSLLEQLLGCAEGGIQVEDVHRLLGTGRAEAIGRLVAAVAARDAAAALAALDEAVTSGADPGGVLEQLLAALRDALIGSVGVTGRLLRQGAPGGVDLVSLGRQLGTDTVLAMLQIVDQSLFRMRSSVHAAVVAEMAIVRLAALDDLQSLADAIERVTAVPQGAASPSPTVRPSASRTVSSPPSSPPPGAAGGRQGGSAVGDAMEPPQKKNGLTAAAGDSPTVEPLSIAEPRDLWLHAAQVVGGLTSDFAAIAERVSWDEDVLVVEMPSSGTAATSFLERPEIAAKLRETLSSLAGRGVRQRLDRSAAAIDPPVAREKPRVIGSQATLLRDAHEHPLVAHARKVFDATVRKVEVIPVAGSQESSDPE